MYSRLRVELISGVTASPIGSTSKFKVIQIWENNPCPIYGVVSYDCWHSVLNIETIKCASIFRTVDKTPWERKHGNWYDLVEHN